jgi:hypothetical protein
MLEDAEAEAEQIRSRACEQAPEEQKSLEVLLDEVIELIEQ